jgi:hypothetical protein
VSDEKIVTKTWSEFSVGGLHLCLALLAEARRWALELFEPAGERA